MLTGCQTTVAVGKNTNDTKVSVAAANNDIKFLAGYISDAWAAKETECAVRNRKAAIASHSVNAQIIAVPNAAAGPGAALATIVTVDENIRAAEEANYNRVIAKIEIGRQQLRSTIINRYGANIAVAQTLLEGQAKYYATSDTTNSTLSGGVDVALAEFSKFAPVITAAVYKK